MNSMNIWIELLIGAWMLGLLVVILLAASAPRGHEDEKGFHLDARRHGKRMAPPKG
jgi:hypothetical protein